MKSSCLDNIKIEDAHIEENIPENTHIEESEIEDFENLREHENE